VALFNGLQKYLTVFFLLIVSAPASFAAASNLGFESDTTSQTTNSTHESTVITSEGINVVCFSAYDTNFRSVVSALERRDTAGSMNRCFVETATIPLHKDYDKVIWSLTPSLGTSSLNPIDDIKNLQVMLKYRF
jgi:hypothetical protein